MKKTALFFGIIFVFTVLQGCDMSSSDSIQREQQEKILAEGTAQVGMPAIKNFRERKILKDILELRDQEGLVTYTYLENLSPVVIPGKTALGGKLTFSEKLLAMVFHMPRNSRIRKG